ncbi:hypothetical protein [Sutcliffiella horikoshii]|uniref:hypothetical protein n=1 Tax=Sutcliffiella horikoshii TaxID=79883 RepID=UPI003CF7EA76
MTSNHNQLFTLADLLAQFEEFKKDESNSKMNLFLFNRAECSLLSDAIKCYWEEQKRQGMTDTWI